MGQNQSHKNTQNSRFGLKSRKKHQKKCNHVDASRETKTEMIDVIDDKLAHSYYATNYFNVRNHEALLIAYGYLRKNCINPTDIATIIAHYIDHYGLKINIKTCNKFVNDDYHLFRMIVKKVN